MINRPHRLVVAVDIGGQDDAERSQTISRILDAIEQADEAIIAAADLVCLEMQAQPTKIRIAVRIPSRYDPAELHRQRDPHCTCNGCQQHMIDSQPAD